MELGSVNLPWVDSPLFDQLVAQSDLDEPTRVMVKSYARDGYVIVDPEISDFDSLAREIIDACSDRPEYQQRLMDEWERVPAVRHLAIAPKILETLATLYRRDPVPMQTLNFGRGTQQLPHSDSMHFSSVPQGFMCGVWVGLEDIDETNGPLEVLSGQSSSSLPRPQPPRHHGERPERARVLSSVRTVHPDLHRGAEARAPRPHHPQGLGHHLVGQPAAWWESRYRPLTNPPQSGDALLLRRLSVLPAPAFGSLSGQDPVARQA